MSNATARLPLLPAPLGVLSIHLDGAACRVGCEFCYLGARAPSDPSSPADGGGANHLDIKMLEDVLSRLDYAEVAVAVSEPAAPVLGLLRAIMLAAEARGKPVAITTTAASAFEGRFGSSRGSSSSRRRSSESSLAFWTS